MKEYKPQEFESKWIKYWDDNKTFKTDVWDFSKPKYYVLDMFPYPSGDGLHIGHPEGYTATDIIARMKKMQGYNVLHPMGFDSFGLPAEQYAIKTGNHPGAFTQKNIANFTRQLKMLGFSYDWDRKVSTCDPSYYKWTQWIFTQMYKDGVAYYKDMPVNWCEELGTVLANDEIIDGKSERGGYPVVKKYMKQLVINTPKYADRLLDGLNRVDWPTSTKEIQRNWIGKSEGVEVEFQIKEGGKFKIFTTCIETIFGITFMVIAPDGDIIKDLMPRIKNKEEVQKYIDETLKKTDLERGDLNKGKSGVKLEGIFAINPVNNKEVPVYAADFVLGGYGTGAVMAVPSHDQRDFEFAVEHKIPMIEVISGGNTEGHAFEKADYLGKSCKLINSENFSGLTVEEAKIKITDWLKEKGVAKKTVNYKLREWIFARQRYWGEPIPVVKFEDGTAKTLEDKTLPLILPEMSDYKGRDGKAPLENAADWVNIKVDGKNAKRETTTMPGAAGSSWYYLRYLDPNNESEIADKKLMEHWLPVDLYVGGPEHATGHLLYSRMYAKFLHDKGICPVEEPFAKLRHQGMILGENNEKMSKSRGNVINPDDIIGAYGTDTLRLYEMFMGAFADSKPWNTKNIEGSRRFVERVWRLCTDEEKLKDQENKNLERLYNETVKKVSEDYEELNFNTAISQMMIFINACYKEEFTPRAYAEGLIKLLSPICPFMAEEIWQIWGNKKSISTESWPTFDSTKLALDEIEIPVQVLSKVKKIIKVKNNASKEEVIEAVRAQTDLDVDRAKKVIFVPNRIINFII